jgi:hypothetical protein
MTGLTVGELDWLALELKTIADCQIRYEILPSPEGSDPRARTSLFSVGDIGMLAREVGEPDLTIAHAFLSRAIETARALAVRLRSDKGITDMVDMIEAEAWRVDEMGRDLKASEDIEQDTTSNPGFHTWPAHAEVFHDLIVSLRKAVRHAPADVTSNVTASSDSEQVRPAPADVTRPSGGKKLKRCWYHGANPKYKQDILAQVDGFLDGTSTRFDFTEDAREHRNDIQRLACELNAILLKSKKSCHFSAPKTGKHLHLLPGPPKRRDSNTRKRGGRRAPSRNRQEIVKKSTKKKSV